MQSKAHWERLYTRRAATEVSWYQAHARRSLELIREAGVPASAAIIDVGGGASTLVDDLLARGHDKLTVLDLSGAALAAARARLGERAVRVHWVEGDILEIDLPAQAYDVWHDRAVFHFLTAPDERRAYVRQVLHAVRPDGFVLVATFADDGPTECSGLPVMRYGVDELHAEFGESFRLLAHEREVHHTPGGKEQRFIYCLFRKTEQVPG